MEQLLQRFVVATLTARHRVLGARRKDAVGLVTECAPRGVQRVGEAGREFIGVAVWRERRRKCGASERIKNTMVSISWRTFTRQCIVASLLLLPWGLVEDFGVWTVLLTVLISYFVIAGEAIARYVETPFGRDEDHLNLEQICGAIDRSVSEVLKVANQEDR